MQRMARFLLLSNGHGEDLSGSLLGKELRGLGHDVKALPLVGLGHPYLKANLPLLGRSHEFSTGGIGYTSLRGRLTELLQGQILYLIRRRSWLHRRDKRMAPTSETRASATGRVVHDSSVHDGRSARIPPYLN